MVPTCVQARVLPRISGPCPASFRSTPFVSFACFFIEWETAARSGFHPRCQETHVLRHHSLSCVAAQCRACVLARPQASLAVYSHVVAPLAIRGLPSQPYMCRRLASGIPLTNRALARLRVACRQRPIGRADGQCRILLVHSGHRSCLTGCLAELFS